MISTQLHDLVPVLQVAIGPVILISGISLLLLTLTNRFGRIIDRSRALVRETRESDAQHHHLTNQIEILYRRARVMRFSITTAAAAVLLASLLIVALFVTSLGKIEAGLLISVFFAASMLFLIASLVAFIKDIQISLTALALELGNSETGKNALARSEGASKISPNHMGGIGQSGWAAR